MESGQIQDPGRRSLKTAGRHWTVGGWAPELLWTFRRRGNSVEPALNRTPANQAHSLVAKSFMPSHN